MKQDFQSFHANLSALDDQAINPSGNASLGQLVDRGRRNLLKGGMGLAALGFLGGSLSACGRMVQSDSLIGFEGIPPQLDPAFDSVQVAPGYSARTFFSWGDAVLADAPEWKPDATDDWQAQLKQAGDNHDGMHFFPFPENPDSHGLLVMNHEYVNPPLHPNGMTLTDVKRPLDEVRKEQAAHGVSVIEVKKDAQGQWQRVMPSHYNRRISAMTPMAVSGPLAGNDALKTASDPSGREIIGTINNCSSGFTPWGTYLVCEENWHNYFVNHDAEDMARRVSHKRYGIEGKGMSKLYGWETADPRFDATPDPAQPHGGHVHEPNRFGWVVELDPFDPTSTPVKRTAFGRYCRECSVLSLGDDGRMAFYSGDDTKGEYVYKFVPAGRYVPGADQANRQLLESGTLYVARFDADGSGEWLALVHGQNGLTADNGFADQAEVLLNARAAGDQVGATPMDRPEWVAVHPHSREVYVTLTNNDNRGVKWPTDKANPDRTICTDRFCAGTRRAPTRPRPRSPGKSSCWPASSPAPGTQTASRCQPTSPERSTATSFPPPMVWRSTRPGAFGSRPISATRKRPCRPWAPINYSAPTRERGKSDAFWSARAAARSLASPGARTTAPCGSTCSTPS